ncbi:glycosyl hydrolase family 8 [Photobacterium sp. DNB23_23_1]|uniref:cellulase n=1 Tax=Photobacterium pectinilyticum TaxID=2906793 RepID=A0ABT1N3G6_9GAMM|nr:glycosyl hydrolase family 8 [Photobacterium sp. ZSDE20]MCQ1059288.1 glycosyl hydrolase family 8 [Photobacterium sp. ZSDE20]MDD1824751.1 glycosyl hydrolase family 8 [Photobacterium sp. ZSDE20]
MKLSPLVMAIIPLLTSSQVAAKVHGCNIRADQQLWSSYKDRFINPGGRVVDNGNGSISHSESQGYGMLMAAFFNDHQTFKQLWQWTQNHLQRQDDPLFAWKWQPSLPHIPDNNNASDGDIFIAWALLKGHQLWPEHQYQQQAKSIINELEASHFVTLGGQQAFLPAQYGFEKTSSTTVNPSYWVYPAFNDFAKMNTVWASLNQGGLSILDSNRYGQYQLPTDWLEYRDNSWQPSEQFPSRFSYSSYRIPLYLIWGGYDDAVNDNYRRWLFQHNKAWVDVEDGQMAPFRAPNGATAVATLVQLSQETYKHRSALPHPNSSDDYYSSSLIIFSHIAFHERYCQ